MILSATPTSRASDRNSGSSGPVPTIASRARGHPAANRAMARTSRSGAFCVTNRPTKPTTGASSSTPIAARARSRGVSAPGSTPLGISATRSLPSPIRTASRRSSGATAMTRAVRRLRANSISR